ncbi:hypothetical protein M433DRAFT_533700 [Acidomyces richmondensis BFW]|nr:MAG: hypothetical protein FE78DRAFT_537632 [Acidomyces sp. 'richmondensis']KYG46750.1 hypothetical protein M433DRAFT_533700 [Acidomyces richmondensis BFW]
MVDHSSGDPSSGSTTDKDYVSRSGQKDHIPVQKDGDPVEDLIDPETANSDKTLENDDADAIDESNIIESRTRGVAKEAGRYREPGDDEGLPGLEDET